MTTTGGDDINLAPENNDNDNDNHDDGNVDLDGHDDSTGDTTAQATAPAAGGGNGPTNFNLRVEQNKIPEFFGAKSKDTISAADFIRRLEDLAKTNRWTDWISKCFLCCVFFLSPMIGGSNDKDFLRTVIKLQILATI